MAETSFYVAPLDGVTCLQVAGRFRRRRMPIAATPPGDVGPADCFLCHPENDRYYQGDWPAEDSSLALLGNAHPYGWESLLIAPKGTEFHEAGLAELSDLDLRRMLDPLSCAEMAADPTDRLRSCFMNMGAPAGQSRRHPHSQVVSLSAGPLSRSAQQEVAEDLEAAADEDRSLDIDAYCRLVLPRKPTMTFEAWVPRPATAYPPSQWAASIRRVLAAVEQISGNYNWVSLQQPNLFRIIPRGISERAGLEFAFPGRVDSVVACSLDEARDHWRQAVAGKKPAGDAGKLT